MSLVVTSSLLTSCGKAPKPNGAPLLVYVGGTMRPAMEELIKLYQARTGQPVQIDYADSGQLLVKIELTRRGDIYVAHDPYLGELMEKGLGDRGWTVASLTPVIVVQKGNPKDIRGFRDLAKPGLRLIIPDPQYATTGVIAAHMATKAGISQEMTQNIVTRTRGGSEAANAVCLGTADAAIVWNAVAHLRLDKLSVVPIEEGFVVKDVVTTPSGQVELDYVRVNVATLKASKVLPGARRFAEFLVSEEGRAVWLSYGFSPANAARPHPAATPLRGDLLVHCAAGMRVPVSAMAAEFEKRHPVKVNVSYDGSNRLLGQIRLTGKGDVYVAGDAEYITMAETYGLVASSETLCHLVPVIMVAKGNPRKIGALRDLTRPGLRIAQGDPKAAAIGRIMPELLSLNGIDPAAWRQNVQLETATVTELALAIKLGTLDAAVVWNAVANTYADSADSIGIDRAKNVCPPVRAAVLRGAANPDAARAFLAYMVSDEARGILRTAGYTLDKP